MIQSLWSLDQQFQNKNGSILTHGKIYVYYSGRTALAPTYSDEDGTVVNPNPIILDNNGRAACFALSMYAYTVVVCDAYGKELFSYDITLHDSVSVAKDVLVLGTDGSVQVDRTEVPNCVQYDLSVNTEKIATKDEIINKQDQLTPGNNIIITDNIISATGIPTKTSELENDSGFATNDWKTLYFSKNPKYANYINHNYLHVRYSLSMRILIVEGWFSLSSNVYITSSTGNDWDPLLILPANDDIKKLPNSFSIVTKDNTFKECSTADLPIRGINFRINQTINSGFYNLITICTYF